MSSLIKINKSIVPTLLFSSLFLVACQNENPSLDSSNGAESSLSTSDPTEDSTSSAEDAIDSSEEATMEDPVEYKYQVNKETQFILPISEEDNKQVALLTFDDAPDKHALEIAQVLKDKETTAIFFVNGMYLESEDGKNQLKEIYDMGYEIGNHTQTHASLPSLSEEQQYEEIMKTSDLVEEITGERPRFFRAPFGQNTDYT